MSEHDRRRFHRFPFEADCRLLVDGGSTRPCELLDLSINGALVELDPGAEFDTARSGDLTLELRGLNDGATTQVVVGVRALRVEDRRIACRFVRVDADSFEQLKGLVADNLGDLALLDRELTQLDYWPGLSVVPASD
ncbi:MAG: PilZ domain-containing protein [Xanthomonadales bacterium]|nr:PilZ domain-containing protein [Xanthomonadales bacterium]